MTEYICPHCKKPIYDEDALLCLYCGGSLNRSVGTLGKAKHPSIKIILIAVAVIVVLAFMSLVVFR